MGEYGGGVWRCEEVSPHTSIPHRGHGRTGTPRPGVGWLVTRVLVGVLVLVVVGGPYAHSHPHTGGRPRPVGTQLPWLQGHLKPQKPQKPLLAFFIMSLMLASNVSLSQRGLASQIQTRPPTFEVNEFN